MASDSPSAAANCLLHNLEPLSCKTGNKRSCEDCVGDHSGHKWITTKKILRQTLQDGPKIEEDMRKMKNESEKCDDDVNKQIERIRTQRANFVSKILEREEALIEKLQNKTSKPLTTKEKKDIKELASNAHVHSGCP